MSIIICWFVLLSAMKEKNVWNAITIHDQISLNLKNYSIQTVKQVLLKNYSIQTVKQVLLNLFQGLLKW